MRMREREIEKYLIWAVECRGGKTYKFKSVSQRGVADRIVCLPGSTWFIELKSPTGSLSALQIIFGNEMKQLQQNYVVLKTKQEIDDWIKQCDTK